MSGAKKLEGHFAKAAQSGRRAILHMPMRIPEDLSAAVSGQNGNMGLPEGFVWPVMMGRFPNHDPNVGLLNRFDVKGRGGRTLMEGIPIEEHPELIDLIRSNPSRAFLYHCESGTNNALRRAQFLATVSSLMGYSSGQVEIVAYMLKASGARNEKEDHDKNTGISSYNDITMLRHMAENKSTGVSAMVINEPHAYDTIAMAALVFGQDKVFTPTLAPYWPDFVLSDPSVQARFSKQIEQGKVIFLGLDGGGKGIKTNYQQASLMRAAMAQAAYHGWTEQERDQWLREVMPLVDKNRTGQSSVSGMEIMRNSDMLRDYLVIGVDDVFATIGTGNRAAQLFKEAGAAGVILCATDGEFAEFYTKIDQDARGNHRYSLPWLKAQGHVDFIFTADTMPFVRGWTHKQLNDGRVKASAKSLGIDADDFVHICNIDQIVGQTAAYVHDTLDGITTDFHPAMMTLPLGYTIPADHLNNFDLTWMVGTLPNGLEGLELLPDDYPYLDSVLKAHIDRGLGGNIPEKFQEKVANITPPHPAAALNAR